MNINKICRVDQTITIKENFSSTSDKKNNAQTKHMNDNNAQTRSLNLSR